MCSNVNILAVDIGGTSVKMGVVSDGRVLENTSIRNVFKGKSDQLMDGIKDICQDYITRYNIKKVGIGCPGDICEGKVLLATNLGWVDFDLYNAFKEVFPFLEISVDNDGHAAALAEMHYGNLKDVEKFCDTEHIFMSLEPYIYNFDIKICDVINCDDILVNWNLLNTISLLFGMHFEGNERKYDSIYDFLFYSSMSEAKVRRINNNQKKKLQRVFKQKNRLLGKIILC